ncbi:hypothetical protein Tco_0785231 [Tanacetum coccineum]
MIVFTLTKDLLTASVSEVASLSETSELLGVAFLGIILLDGPRLTFKTLAFNELLSSSGGASTTVNFVSLFFKFKAGSKSCSLSKQDSYITTRVGITIPPSYSNAEDNRLGINPLIQPEPEDLPKDNPKLEIAVLRWQSAPASEY